MVLYEQRTSYGFHSITRRSYSSVVWHSSPANSVTTTSTGAINGSRVYYHAYGTTRAGNTADLKSGRTFTGQKQDGTGLLYYNARYYDPALGTFISPDTLVPDPGLVFDYNRYMYVRGNPLRYTDPTGHLSEDQIRALLGNDFETLYHYWQTYDPYWLDVLATLEEGGILWASQLGGQLHVEGAGLNLQLVARAGASSNRLWDWQGKGVYTIQNPGTGDVARLRDEVFDRNQHVNQIISPVFDYSQRVNGRIRPFYLGAMRLTQSIDPQYSSASFMFLERLGFSEFAAQIGSYTIQTAGSAAAGEAVAAAGIATGFGASILGGATVLAVDIVPASIWATYDTPRVYSVGWPGGGIVNPAIQLENLRR
jgi:RHS repeat-associated protein